MPHIDNDVKLDFKDVLLRPKRSTLKSRSEVDLTRSFSFRNSKQTYSGVPIIAANMDTVGTFEMAKVLCKFSLFTAVHKHYSLVQWQEFAGQNPDCLEHLAASSGTGSSDFEQLEQILEAIPQVKYICLDVANGYSEHFVEFVKDVRKRFPQHTIMAGNVVTGEMVEELILSGADIIKVGIGPGSVCTTRKKTGVGYPQLSAVMECADAAHGLKGHIISDGGCSCPGDVAKAFGAGADFVMLGGMLAGHSESGGELIQRDGKKYKLFYGMSSEMAMKKYAGGVAEYRYVWRPRSLVIVWRQNSWLLRGGWCSSQRSMVNRGTMLGSGEKSLGLRNPEGEDNKVFPTLRASEGKTVEVPFKGDVEHTIRDILGGIRSTCTYVGAAKLKELSRRTTFIRVTQQVNPIFSEAC
ncbi:GMP reductase 2 isoform X2 [Pan paniscus]|nr:GMP reductase 2 isoform X2 [Pan paniscus]XP_008959504.1 GMP reductase 2 isoform X2 [Pan paniscus]XP_008959505.1 GMP reductase 2 isoform X2 [Pan paniscus]XP_024204434.1 GMP reductase 2 isoform X2 [Pan troglodytes]XP_024204435.1 GMP reductase 2 isoform X2 [Pan troglodytes]XP_024204436.1 GMP reductase 2 isoform X2 [Pan troglodytes]